MVFNFPDLVAEGVGPVVPWDIGELGLAGTRRHQPTPIRSPAETHRALDWIKDASPPFLLSVRGVLEATVLDLLVADLDPWWAVVN